jgi:branched-chain amino acid transport system ATP-binding protein
MLRAEDLVVRYGPVTALRGVSLEVAEGEVVGLIGPNGAGKTTTLHAICGFQPPVKGIVTLDGKALSGSSPEAIARRGVALVPEGRHIFATLTVAENLRLGLTARRANGSAEALERALERFPVLRRFYRSSAGRLSGGEQQQLAIARALLANPRLLLLDEPSLGLAPFLVDLVFDTLAELHEEGVTILLVEQNAARTVAFADRTYVLRTGAIAHAGTREQLAREVDLAEAYLGL